MLAGPEELSAAVSRLRQSGIVAFPTETVYGLGADAFNERAISRVFELKGRPAHNPLIVHVSGPAMARQVVAAWPREAQLAAAAFWPGPLSIVLPKVALVPAIITGGGDTVAVRCPDHPTTLALLEAFGGPLVGPSANPSGRISPTTAAHVRESFSEADVLVLDGGPCRAGIESTVLSLVDPLHPDILRPGVIGPEAIAKVVGQPVTGATARLRAVPDEQDITARRRAVAPMSPGLLESHYAPVTPAVLIDGSELPRLLSIQAEPATVMTWSGLDVPRPHTPIRCSHDAATYAAGLYAALRCADALKPSLIAIERPPRGDNETDRAIWAAVLDRLTRATARPTP
jgi:L-threonylcarbamoyladenylate synthase